MKSISIKHKKGQLSIGDAPGVVLIVLFLFMVMGTSAFILEKYQEAFGADESITRVNETLTTVAETGETVVFAGACNFENFEVILIINASDDAIIASTNYTASSAGLISYIGDASAEFNNTDWEVTYEYDYTGIACNVTTDLTGEVEDNTSIAGMVLTIALIGIVLSILIGLFYVFTRRRGL